MSNKERCMQLLDTLPESKLAFVLAYLQGISVAEELEDDAFCEALYQEYLADPDKGDGMPLEEVCKELGIEL